MVVYEAEKYDINEIKQYFDYKLSFVSWYQSKIREGYQPELDLDDINNLINKVTLWYEFKYTNDRLERNHIDGGKGMTINRLKESLSEKEKHVIGNHFRIDNSFMINYVTDKELKDWIFSLINLSIIFSRNTSLEYGRLRAKKFREEIEYFYQIRVSEPLKKLTKSK